MARRVVSLDDQLSKFPAHLLDIPCAESNLGKLVHMIDTESMVLMAIDSLGLTDVEVKDVREIWPNKPAVQRLEMFKIWQQKNQSQATYRCVCVCVCVRMYIPPPMELEWDFVCYMYMYIVSMYMHVVHMLRGWEDNE